LLLYPLVYKRSRASRLIWTSTFLNQSAVIWGHHLLAMTTYMGLLKLVLPQMVFQPMVSVALVLQATFVLFQHAKRSGAGLIWLSVGLYALSSLKILLVDMQGFSLIQKILVFILIGLAMLGAAYLYQKINVRNYNKVNC
ncbi:MAG: hypothetical protein OXE99_03400, partial [Cellvibrionales bacterium]|nr:hypothetical protein [Cellvibrionales bacterium]